MLKKFSRQQIISEHTNLKENHENCLEREIFTQWMLFESWVVGDYSANDYLYGFKFKGFLERSADEIILDFDANHLLSEPLTEEEIAAIMVTMV